MQFNLTGRYAIRSLNRLCPLDANNREARKKVKPREVWVFNGHANPLAVGFGYWVKEGQEERYVYRGGITNCREDPEEEFYNIHNWSIKFVRLAFLRGCGTAGGKTRRWRGDPVPEEQPISASFHKQGADAVIG